MEMQDVPRYKNQTSPKLFKTLSAGLHRFYSLIYYHTRQLVQHVYVYSETYIYRNIKIDARPSSTMA